jgi:hypothetical protein
VTHTCNPNYSGGRDEEDLSSKPTQANSLRVPILKITNTKRAGGVAQGVGPEFKPWYQKKKVQGQLGLYNETRISNFFLSFFLPFFGSTGV